MKRLVLKGWVITMLMVINFFAVLVLASDNGDLKTFLITKLIALTVLVLNCSIIVRFASKKYFD